MPKITRFGIFLIFFNPVTFFLFLGAVGSRLFTSDQQFYDEHIENVERVLMHEPGYYSLLVNQGDKLITRSFGRYGSPSVKLIPDVNPGQKMWAEIIATRISRSCFLAPIWKCEEIWRYRVNVHVTNSQVVEGASWDHGKFGRGKTIPIY